MDRQMKEDKWMNCWYVDRREGEERESKKEGQGRSKCVNGGIADRTFAAKANWTLGVTQLSPAPI